MVLNEEDRKPILIFFLNCIIKEVAVLGNFWRMNFRLKTGRKSRWIFKTGWRNLEIAHGVDRTKRSPDRIVSNIDCWVNFRQWEAAYDVPMPWPAEWLRLYSALCQVTRHAADCLFHIMAACQNADAYARVVILMASAAGTLLRTSHLYNV